MGKQAYDKRVALANALNTSGVAKAPPPKKEEPKPQPVPSKGAGKRKKQEEEEPQKTKKEIEAEQRQLIEENERKRAQFYQDEAIKKVQARTEADSAVTYVEDKDTRKPKAVADISDYWKSDLGLLPFTPDDNVGPVEVGGEVDPQDRLEYLQMFNDQLAQLLRLKFHVFWSQMIHDDKVRRCLDSYLRFCLRSYDACAAEGGSPQARGGQDLVADGSQKVAREISRRVLAVYVRLSRPQESAHEFISDGKFAQVIYEHNLFDIPKLIDLCAIYGDTNRTAVTKIVHSVFRHQPLYKDEFESVVQHMLGSLHQCCEPLQEAAKANGKSAELSVEECLLFLPDMLSCFNAIFCFFPEECVEKVVGGKLSVPSATVVDVDGEAVAVPLADLMVLLHDAVMGIQQTNGTDHSTVLRTIVALLSRLLGLVLGFRMAPRRGPAAFDELLEWLRAHEERASLLLDLGRYGLESCAMEWLASGLVDDAQLDYLEQLCGPILPEGERRRGRARAKAPPKSVAVAAGAAGGAASSSASGSKPAVAADASDRAKIKEIREVVGSDYGEGFLLQCLMHFGGSVPAVVGAVFDGSLPPHIAALPQGASVVEAFSQASVAADAPGASTSGLSADDKRRVLGQAQRMADNPGRSSDTPSGPSNVDAYVYDDDVDDAEPMPSGFRIAAGAMSDSEGDAGDDGEVESDSDGGDPRWGGGGGGKGLKGGKGKGRGPVQGQTYQARRKEENKARVGNHNRRDGAMRKMMRGMM
mmetsp:Transcript_57339/g.166453  ORF Transcript_57339/g.166453 Transcript_57339/m.166453 type:complete len:755 (-) Transcript_57339:119-2383(-)